MAQVFRNVKLIQQEINAKKKLITRTLALYEDDVDVLNDAAAKKAKREKACSKKSTEKNLEALASANANFEDCVIRYQTQGQMLDDDFAALNALYEELVEALVALGKKTDKVVKEQAKTIENLERLKAKIEKRVRTELPEVELSIDEEPEEEVAPETAVEEEAVVDGKNVIIKKKIEVVDDEKPESEAE